MTRRTILSALVLLATAAVASRAQLREWRVADPALHARTTAALVRYYAVVRADSLRLRYLQRNARTMTYRLRGVPGSSGGRGQIVSMSLGQLTLFPESNVRIALGEDLYMRILDARALESASDHAVGDGFGRRDWGSTYTAQISLDRAEYRFTPTLGLFASLGAPESNLFWWSDATGTLGVTTPDWEFGVLFPLAAGAAPIGPFRARLMAPAWGATGHVEVGPFAARARFAVVGEPTFDAIRIAPDYYVHTISSQLTYRHSWESAIGLFRIDGGIGYEEYTQAASVADSITYRGHVRRLAPLADLAWSNPERTLHATLGYADFAPRIGFSARLTEQLWLEADMACAGLLRDTKAFEHPFYLFITPRIKF